MHEEEPREPSEETKRRIERELLREHRKAMSQVLSRFGHIWRVVGYWRNERAERIAEAEQAQAAGDTERAARARARADELTRDLDALNIDGCAAMRWLHAVPAELRRLLIYHYLHEHTWKETAEHFGIASGTFAKMKNKALDTYAEAVARID